MAMAGTESPEWNRDFPKWIITEKEALVGALIKLQCYTGEAFVEVWAIAGLATEAEDPKARLQVLDRTERFLKDTRDDEERHWDYEEEESKEIMINVALIELERLREMVNEYIAWVSMNPPALALALEELEPLNDLFLPREIINLLLDFGFGVGADMLRTLF